MTFQSYKHYPHTHPKQAVLPTLRESVLLQSQNPLLASIHTSKREAQTDFDPVSIGFILLILPNWGESVLICISRKAELRVPHHYHKYSIWVKVPSKRWLEMMFFGGNERPRPAVIHQKPMGVSSQDGFLQKTSS